MSTPSAGTSQRESPLPSSERIANIHEEHKHVQSNAIIFIVVVLLLYATALVFLLVRYVRRDTITYMFYELVTYFSQVNTHIFRRRRSNANSDEPTEENPQIVVTVAPEDTKSGAPPSDITLV